jgi:hypothetical protein
MTGNAFSLSDVTTKHRETNNAHAKYSTKLAYKVQFLESVASAMNKYI